MNSLNVAAQFSKFPAGRFKTDGPYSGEQFRELLVARLKTEKKVVVDLDGTAGYGSSFLEEAFGGLVRQCGFHATDLKARLEIRTADAALHTEVWSYINEATPER